MRVFRGGCVVMLLAFAGVVPAHAQIKSEYDLDAYLPRESALIELKQKIKTNPGIRENYYACAQMATTLNKSEDAAWCYERLLALDPSLDPVRLDLSLIYVSLGRYDEARAMLNGVLERKPPKQVRENIEIVLDKIDRATRRHHFSASITGGIGSDTNANAAPGSGNILVLDTTVPLGEGAQARRDIQKFTAATVSHAYDIGKVSEDVSMRWQSSAITYLTRQHALPELNLQLYGVRSGPEFVYRPADVHFTVMGGYNFLRLDAQSYLRDPSVEAILEFPIYAGLRGWLESQWEYREFLNSRTVTTYHDRAGQARQGQAGLRYPFSKNQMWEAAFTLRKESAKQDYYANTQAGVVISDTYSFPSDIAGGWFADTFAVARGGYKESFYDESDPLVSVKKRNDSERSAQLMIGRKLMFDTMVTAAYAYTDVMSNIENYEYDNHRYALTFTKNF